MKLLGVLLTTGALLADPYATVAAHAAATPIQHVVVLMQENRSFDSYFGHIHYEGQPHATPERPNVGFHKTHYCEVADLNHSWNGTHQEIDGGRMDGFMAANQVPADPTGSRAMGWYDQTDLPFYYSLYSTFAMGDHYFASAPTQTFPNRFYLLAGTSFGHIRNDLPDANGFAQRSVFNELDEHHVTWKVYAAQYPLAIAFLFSYVRDHDGAKVVPYSDFAVDAAAGTLPQVAFIDPIFTGPNNVENDEHPPSNVQVGEQFTASVISTLFGSPDWGSSALFLTYDEHGGFFDHAAPPPAVPPDDIPPMLQPGDTPGAFDMYGVRVPAVVVSPYARAHFVSHVVNDHTSILRFIEDDFGLGTLTRRDAAANDMREFFDFSHATFATPPALPPAPLNPAEVAYCASQPSNTFP
ncbi:MAG TPA: alkaline phosphatase family protein [Candidatus Dormibacteraeota bacterium]